MNFKSITNGLLALATTFISVNVFSQAAQSGRLYLSTAGTGRIYDITAVTQGTQAATQAGSNFLVTGYGETGGSNSDRSSLAVGFDASTTGGPFYFFANVAANATIYKDNFATNGVAAPVLSAGGISTNNTPGPLFGVTYGNISGEKQVTRFYPTPSNTVMSFTPATGDNIFATAAAFGADGSFDYENNMFQIVTLNGTSYIYRENLLTGVATQFLTLSGAALPGSAQGIAYLRGFLYLATVSGTNIEIRSINMSTGVVSGIITTLTGFSNSNLDLGSVDYFVPFTFNCGSATVTGNPYIQGVAATKILNIPISNVYLPTAGRQYTINISGPDFTAASSTQTIVAGQTSINVPVTYNGTGTTGIRSLTIQLNNSTTTCAVVAHIDIDSDGDGIGNTVDFDNDNDGILDVNEDVCTTKIEGTPVYSETFGTGNTQTTNPFVLGHSYTAVNPNDGSYTVTRSLGQTSTYTRTNRTGDLDAGYTTIGSGSTDGRYLMININSPGFNTQNQPIFRIPNLPVEVGREYRFRLDLAGLLDVTPITGGDIPNLQLTIRDVSNNNILASANSSTLGVLNDDVWRRLILNFTATSSRVTIEIANLQTNGSNGNDVGIDNIVLVPLSCDADGDLTPNDTDVDSDNDGCPDALEGSENVRITHVYPLNFATVALRGQIRVTHDGVTAGTPAEVISTSNAANGVPQLVNNAANNPNTTPANTAGVADNTDGTADVGQGIGSSQNMGVQDPDCLRCFKPANTASVGIDTTHGFTALNRAGANNGNWPMKIKSAYTVMDAKTLGFVINRLTTTQINAISTANNAVIGMAVYDTTANCLKIYDGTGWFCYTKQTCDQ